jgi:hypothetical protein
MQDRPTSLRDEPGDQLVETVTVRFGLTQIGQDLLRPGVDIKMVRDIEGAFRQDFVDDRIQVQLLSEDVPYQLAGHLIGDLAAIRYQIGL